MWTNYSLCSVTDQEMLKVESLNLTRPARSVGSPALMAFNDIIAFLLGKKLKCRSNNSIKRTCV